ncbi:MerR family transcriptional regulator [Streptomyces sp. V4-01]|uniref:MerR family transcriptional regulator n=1 Tax=Actinacidiphila polyblastidii TaxID=3110430 RepID=A0ABU7P669_9ACTN|nr:MerR family transcriptional regulator [Streptomyces sp. V4-01]
MESEMRGIGEMARCSGLSVSALRFYDGAGVLVPSWVDPVNGYRWYAPGQLDEARLLARLRAAGMPLADIRLVLAGWSSADTELVRRLLRTHLRRLERDLSDARTELSTVRALLDHRENPMASAHTATVRFTVPAPALAAALDAVRFAASTDPELPMLGGVLLDVEGASLHAVATDRYRMAVAHARGAADGAPRAQVIVPSPVADAMRALLDGGGSVQLTVEGGQVALDTGAHQAAGQCLDHDFPDYRRLVRLPAGTRAVVDVRAFRAAVENGPFRTAEGAEPGGGAPDLSVLRVAGDGTVAVCAEEDDDQDGVVAVNRAFLLDALDALAMGAAGARDRLVLEFGAPNAPMAIRRTDTEDAFSILMPVRLDA